MEQNDLDPLSSELIRVIGKFDSEIESLEQHEGDPPELEQLRLRRQMHVDRWHEHIYHTEDEGIPDSGDE